MLDVVLFRIIEYASHPPVLRYDRRTQRFFSLVHRTMPERAPQQQFYEGLFGSWNAWVSLDITRCTWPGRIREIRMQKIQRNTTDELKLLVWHTVDEATFCSTQLTFLLP